MKKVILSLVAVNAMILIGLMALVMTSVSAQAASNDPLCFTNNGTMTAQIMLKQNGTSWTNAIPSVEYKLDDAEWQSVVYGTNIAVTEGSKVSFRASSSNATFSESKKNYLQFVMVGSDINASGNVMSLLDASCERNDVPAYAFYRLFRGCYAMVSAPELPATELNEYCYCYMFFACNRLEVAPELPATKMAMKCYCYMFNDCYAMTQAPVLPATELAEGCYKNMFGACSNLQSAPQLKSAQLAEDCYYGMFADCHALTRAPELPATELNIDCYNQMFAYCHNLETAPELPATELVEGCYQQMFKGCKKLGAMTVSFDALESATAIDEMMDDVAEEGLFVCHADINTELLREMCQLPSKWEIRTDRPDDNAEPMVGTTTAVEEAQVAAEGASKMIENGRVVIAKGGVKYDMNGRVL